MCVCVCVCVGGIKVPCLDVVARMQQDEYGLHRERERERGREREREREREGGLRS